MRRTSGDHETPQAANGKRPPLLSRCDGPSQVATCFPECASQSSTAPSSVPAAIRCPSGDQQTLKSGTAGALCSVRSACPWLTSQSRTVLSELADASRPLEGDQAML